MELTRRGLVQAATLALVPFTTFRLAVNGKPVFPLPEKNRAVMWGVFLAGTSTGADGYRQFLEARRDAKSRGWEVLDSIHAVDESSKFLARYEMGLNYARDQERRILNGKGSPILGDRLALKALWVEVA